MHVNTYRMLVHWRERRRGVGQAALVSRESVPSGHPRVRPSTIMTKNNESEYEAGIGS